MTTTPHRWKGENFSEYMGKRSDTQERIKCERATASKHLWGARVKARDNEQLKERAEINSEVQRNASEQMARTEQGANDVCVRRRARESKKKGERERVPDDNEAQTKCKRQQQRTTWRR